MKDKKKKRRLGHTIGTILKVALLVPNLLNLASHLVSVAKMEARLAGRNIVRILMLSVIAAFLLVTSWLCLLSMLGVYLISLHWSYMAVLAVVLLLNIILLLIIGSYCMKAKRHISFPATRRQCRTICTLTED